MHGKRPTVSSLHGVVAAAHPLAAQAGAKLLGSGGNAFDAAAATAAALTVVEPYMSSLAGLGCATCYIAAENRVRVLDFVPRVPAKFPVARLSKRAELARGALSVAAPANFAGWAELVHAYGKKPLAAALAPAIALASDGFGLSEFGVAEINEQRPLIKEHPSLFQGWAATYGCATRPVALGQILRQPQLARTLEELAADGAGTLYGGRLADAILAHVAKLGGCLTIEDLGAVKPEWRNPLVVRYRDLLVNSAPPPSEAFQFLLALRILDGFDLSRLPRNGVEHLDCVWRAIRLAAGERVANALPRPDELARVLADGNVERLRTRLRAAKPIDAPTEQWTGASLELQGEQHTTSFSVGDRAGNVVCVTQSLGSPFGSGVVVPGTGVCLNNLLFWADVTPASPNRARPGDALCMCLAPSISLRENACVLALGTPGSYGILQTQVQALVQYRDFGLSLQDAIEEPRARLWDGRLVEAESRLDAAVLDALSQRGHVIRRGEPWTMRVGGMQAIAIDPATGLMIGACDPRRDGYVATG